MNDRDMPVRKTMCATCPFRPGSKYAYLQPELTNCAITEASRICHSTGSNNAINKRTGFKPHICRGSRDIQLQVMAMFCMIDKPTDKAWNDQRVKIGMKPQIIQNPEKQSKVR